MSDIENRKRWVVVTGGSDGIGLAIAEGFGRNGDNVVIIGHEAKQLEVATARIREYGVQAEGICADLRDNKVVMTLASAVLKMTTKVDVLVNNVGMIRFTPLKDVTEEEFDNFATLNLKAGYFLTQGLLDELTAARGSVINMTSYFANKMLPGRPSTGYSMTKGAIVSLTKAMAYEFGPLGIRVNAIAPGTVDTPGRTAEILKMSRQAQEDLAAFNKRSYPIGRIGKPEDVAGLAVFLASPAAEWITGSIMAVDGGLTTG